jgi:hypothetical protein
MNQNPPGSASNPIGSSSNNQNSTNPTSNVAQRNQQALDAIRQMQNPDQIN